MWSLLASVVAYKFETSFPFFIPPIPCVSASSHKNLYRAFSFRTSIPKDATPPGTNWYKKWYKSCPLTPCFPPNKKMCLSA